MSSRFTEQETEQYYDSEDSIYRQVWDDTGSVHWGIFDSATGNDFLKACANHNRLMVQKARIGQDSKVLDMGCWTPVQFVGGDWQVQNSNPEGSEFEVLFKGQAQGKGYRSRRWD